MYNYEIDISHYSMKLVDELMVKLSNFKAKDDYKVHIDFSTYIIYVECKDKSDFGKIQDLVNVIIG